MYKTKNKGTQDNSINDVSKLPLKNRIYRWLIFILIIIIAVSVALIIKNLDENNDDNLNAYRSYNIECRSYI